MPKGIYQRRTGVERLWSKVNKTDTCWLWTANAGNDGGSIMQHTIGEMKEALQALQEEYKELRFECNETFDPETRKHLLILLELSMAEISKLERDVEYFQGLYVDH